MNILQRIELWGDRHHPKWLDIIRIALGLFLCYKGVDVLLNMSELTNMMANRAPFSSFAFLLAGHYAAFAHIIGGILLAWVYLPASPALFRYRYCWVLLFFLAATRIC